LIVASAAPVAADESCVVCHPQVRAEYAQSVHAAALGCTSCHGGDAGVVSAAAHATDKGYIGTPARADVPHLCGDCHADPERMRPYHLPTDQYQQYRSSRHGMLLAEGDVRVAVCTDCHGVHGIVGHDEPTSPVARQNVPETCGRCHADAELMAPYKIRTDQLAQFRGSVHGQALYVEEHPAAPTCATCHGAHGATPPQGGTIATVCGQCHPESRAYVNASPHRAAVERGAMAECIDCHGAHDTPAPDHRLFATACPSCHAPDTPGLAVAQKLATLIGQTREAFATAAEDIDRVATVAPTVVRHRARLQQGRAFLVEALPAQHALAVERVEDLTRSARSISDEVRAAAHAAEQDTRMRWLYLALAWVVLAFAIVVAVLLRHERRQARARGTAGPS
jgi:hypothetical protein